MDRASFLELVLSETGEITIERWKDGKAKRERMTFKEACKLQGEEIFVCLGQNGTIRTLASDTDDREIMLPPSVSSETSKDRFENLWLFPTGITRHEAEIMLTYLDPHSPPVVKEKLRLPDTVSVKHGEPFTVRIAEASGKPYTPAQVFGISAPVETVGFVDMAWLKTPGPFDAGSLDKAVAWLSKRKNADRETKSWMERTDLSMRSLILRLLKKGFDERDTIWLAEASAGNPFRDWKYGVREELAKILVIARAAKGAMLLSDRINHVRGGKTGPNQRPFQLRNTMAKIAMEDFERNAQLLHATDSTLWAVDRRTGVAMEVVHGSQPIRHYITARYGINPVDVDHKHLLEEMIRVVTARPNTAEVTSISHFQVESGRMFVSFGGREVVVLSKDGISLQENGTDGIIFKPVQGADVLATKLLPIEEALEAPAGDWWQKILPPEHLKNLVRGDPQEVSVLLYIWTLFFMFRNMAASRPIGMFLGPAGSGKTTLSKKLHLLFYGKGVKLFTVKSNQDYWVTTTSNYPLTMFDNVDAPTPWWLPSALAVSITPTDVTKRTLYSNNTPYVQRMDSIVALSSHDASFLKDDVIDRAILVQFSRIPEEERLEEMPMLDAVINNREELLAGMMADVVRVLRTERPLATKGSAIRIVDFAAIGRWIARALGVEDTFLSALNDLSVHQTAKVLEEDIVLVMSLETMQEESAYCDEWLTHTQIWNEIIALSEDRGESFKAQYKNTATFGRKMLAIYTQLHDAIGVESRDDIERGWKLYRIGSKQRRDRERKKQLGLDVELE